MVDFNGPKGVEVTEDFLRGKIKDFFFGGLETVCAEAVGASVEHGDEERRAEDEVTNAIGTVDRSPPSDILGGWREAVKSAVCSQATLSFLIHLEQCPQESVL